MLEIFDHIRDDDGGPYWSLHIHIHTHVHAHEQISKHLYIWQIPNHNINIVTSQYNNGNMCVAFVPAFCVKRICIQNRLKLLAAWTKLAISSKTQASDVCVWLHIYRPWLLEAYYHTYAYKAYDEHIVITHMVKIVKQFLYADARMMRKMRERLWNIRKL